MEFFLPYQIIIQINIFIKFVYKWKNYCDIFFDCYINVIIGFVDKNLKKLCEAKIGEDRNLFPIFLIYSQTRFSKEIWMKNTEGDEIFRSEVTF